MPQGFTTVSINAKLALEIKEEVGEYGPKVSTFVQQAAKEKLDRIRAEKR